MTSRIPGMVKNNKNQTQTAYEDTNVVAGYLSKHGKNPKMHEAVERFAKSLPGKRVVDVGCGPGQDSWHFARLGFEATGVDFSSKMIEAAKSLNLTKNPPNFVVGDMREIGEQFPEDSFDGAWVCASLLHVEREDVPKVLIGLRKVVANNGRVYIGVKRGQGEELKRENKYGPEMARRFIYWQRENFEPIATKAGFEIDRVDEGEGNGSSWLNVYLVNRKSATGVSED